MDKRITVKFSFGSTLVSALILIIILAWNKTLAEITTFELFSISIISFIIGLSVSLALKFLKLKTDYNATAISLVIFSGALFYVMNDVAIGIIPVGIVVIALIVAGIFGVLGGLFTLAI